MDQQESHSDIFQDLEVDASVQHSFWEASRWSRFIAITYAIASGLAVVALLFAGKAILEGFVRAGNMEELAGATGILGGFLIVMLLIVLGITATLIVLLLRFANQTRSGLQHGQQATFNNGLKSLKVYFIIYGSLTLVGTLFVLLAAVVSMFALSR